MTHNHHVTRVNLDLAVAKLFDLSDKIEAVMRCDQFDAFLAARTQRPDLYSVMNSYPPSDVERALERWESKKSAQTAKKIAA